MVCRSNAPNLSIKTAVISTTTTLNNLMINYWQSPSLLLSHTLSLSLSVSVSFPSLTSFLSQRLDTGSNMKAADLCLGLSQVILLLVPQPLLLTGYPLSIYLSFSVCLSLFLFCSFCLSYLPTLCCYSTCQVATGTLISPLILRLNPSVDSIQPSFMSEKSRSKTPRCLTLQKLTGVSLTPLPSSPSSSCRKTLYFHNWKLKKMATCFVRWC